VLLRLTVHRDAVAVFDRPRALSRLEDDRVATHLEDANLERRARTQRRIEEDERHLLAVERLHAVTTRVLTPRRLQGRGVGEDLLELRARPVERRQKVAEEGRGVGGDDGHPVCPLSNNDC